MGYQALINAEYESAKSIQKSAEALSAEQLSTVEAHLAKAEELEGLQAKQKLVDEKLASVEQPLERKTASAPVVTHQKELFIEDPKKGFKNEQEFFSSVIKTTRTGANDKRLSFLAVQGQDEQHTLSDSLGGYLVPEAFDPRLLEIAPEGNPLEGKTMNIPMQAPVVKIPARVDKDHTTSVAGGIVVGRSQETQDIKTSQMKFEQIVLSVNELSGATFTTNELLNDSPLTISAILSKGFAEAFADAKFEEMLRGNGVGQPEGIFNSDAFIGVDRDTSNEIKIDDVLNIRSRVYGYGDSSTCWLANHATLVQLAKLGGTTGSAFSLVYMPSSQVDVPDMLLGKPLYYSETLNNLGQDNDLVCVNASQYLTGTYQPLQSAESTHVRFLSNENVFKMWERNDGRSWWTSPLKTKRGAPTLSPFVGLKA